ncbi:hypothetical protein [Paenibacillus sp. GYB003]|uniref:hypothetical protein n=1 Tax=Paenibacillus sp. GYB003 TaxID=2994392 RepID=UPI002F966E4C
MSEPLNERELVQYIADRTKIASESIATVLRHEQAFMDQAHKGAGRDVEIDSDELVDYIMSRPDVKLTEPDVDTILELEMSYLLERGLAGYDD